VFKLQHLLDCHILHHREELEEITTAAVKEEQIETKLAGIESDWVALNLVSAHCGLMRQAAFKPHQTTSLLQGYCSRVLLA
jgi:dynein heavy chain